MHNKANYPLSSKEKKRTKGVQQCLVDYILHIITFLLDILRNKI